MFGSSSTKDDESDAVAPPSSSIPDSNDETLSEQHGADGHATTPIDKKRRSSSVAKAKDIFHSAKNAFQPHNASADKSALSPLQKLSRNDPALGVPQGSHNNSAGESHPGAKSTFRVGVTEDKNKKCRRTMEDTHAYLYNFLSTPQPNAGPSEVDSKAEVVHIDPVEKGVAETDNGYFAIFDGHAGNFAADWCGKKLHHILEDVIRKNPSTPIPELLDQTFTMVDQQLEKLPLKNSGCTAVTAVLRWEDRVPNSASATGSTYLNQAAAKAAQSDAASKGSDATTTGSHESNSGSPKESKLLQEATRQRVLYTANVGDARIVLCRNGRALRLTYDHKGSDEQEGRRVANAGGLILNNRVNGVLAVTRALGDTYMKDLVTGHPYTTETVIQPDQDEFIILACDGLWDVCSDQEAVDLIRPVQDPQQASKMLVDHALARFSTDNLSCMVVRFDNKALKEHREAHNIGVEGDAETLRGTMSEADAIVSSVKKLQDQGNLSGPTPNTIDAAMSAAGEAPSGDSEGKVPELNAQAVEDAMKKKKDGAGAGTEGTEGL